MKLSEFEPASYALTIEFQNQYVECIGKGKERERERERKSLIVSFLTIISKKKEVIVSPRYLRCSKTV